MYVDGCRVILRQLDTAQTGSEVIEALSERYEVEALDPAQLLLRVKVNDARFVDEAVVRLACVLDEIDPDWQERFAWPKGSSLSP
jgi:hypothetical protein